MTKKVLVNVYNIYNINNIADKTTLNILIVMWFTIATIELVPLPKQKIRLDYLDIAKGLAIYLVAIGHVPEAFDAPLYRVAIYTFHMPLFFLVSGTISLALSCVLMAIIERYIPQLFGKKLGKVY